MPIADHAAAAQKIAAFLKTLTSTGGLRLKYRITAGAGAHDPDGLEAREIYVEMSGPDAVLLTQRGGELLRALEHIAAKIVRLEAEEHDTISFDANSFKALRARELKLAAETAAAWVTAASAMMEAYCRRPTLNTASYTERMRVPLGAQTVRLSYGPLASVDTVKARYVRPNRHEELYGELALQSLFAAAFAVPGQWVTVDTSTGPTR